MASPTQPGGKRLQRLLAGAVPPLALMSATRELVGARAWLREHTVAGVEGVVVKHRQHGYRPQRRSSWKVRTRTAADAVVGGVIGSLDAPDALLLGLPDERGRLRVAGRTGPLTLPARRELGPLLVPRRGFIPGRSASPPASWASSPRSLSITHRPNRSSSSKSTRTPVSRRGGGDTSPTSGAARGPRALRPRAGRRARPQPRRDG